MKKTVLRSIRFVFLFVVLTAVLITAENVLFEQSGIFDLQNLQKHAMERAISSYATVNLDVSGGSGEWLNLRKQPDAKSEKVMQIKNGTLVRVLRQSGNWSYVEYDGTRAWCKKSVARLVPDKMDPKKTITITSAKSSSNYNALLNAPAKAFDGRTDTCWIGASDDGEQPEILFNLPEMAVLHGFKLLNGYAVDPVMFGVQTSKNNFQKHSRIEKFEITLSDGTVRKFKAKDLRETSYGENIFYLTKPMQVSRVRLSVRSVYPGSKWDNRVCLSEIAFF